jgi:hypothetical protein
MTDTEKEKVEQIKAEMGRGWWTYLMENTGKSHQFVSKMVNGLETRRPEWQWVIKRIQEQKAIKAHNEAATDEVLA